MEYLYASELEKACAYIYAYMSINMWEWNQMVLHFGKINSRQHCKPTKKDYFIVSPKYKNTQLIM